MIQHRKSNKVETCFVAAGCLTVSKLEILRTDFKCPPLQNCTRLTFPIRSGTPDIWTRRPGDQVAQHGGLTGFLTLCCVGTLLWSATWQNPVRVSSKPGQSINVSITNNTDKLAKTSQTCFRPNALLISTSVHDQFVSHAGTPALQPNTRPIPGWLEWTLHHSPVHGSQTKALFNNTVAPN